MSSIVANSAQTPEYIVRSSKPRVEYPNISVAECIAKAIEQRDPSLIALVNPGNGCTLTYGELHRQAQKFGATLVKAGVTKRDFVMFLSENSFEYVGALLGTIYLGLSICSVVHLCSPYEIATRTKDLAATVLVFASDKVATVERTLNDPRFTDTMKQMKILVQMGGDEVQLTDHPDKVVFSYEQMVKNIDGQLLESIPNFPFTDLANDHYFLSYSTGTTGPPKGAIHTNQSIVSAFYNKAFPLLGAGNSTNAPIILWHPMGHTSGMFLIQNSLFNGEKVILFKQDAPLEAFLSAVERYKVARLAMPANFVETFAQTDYQKKYDLSSLKFVITSGVGIPTKAAVQIREKYNVLTLEVLGATEFIGAVGDRDWNEFSRKFVPGNLGTVTPNTEMKIIDLKSGQTLPANQNGEICFRGPSCFVGYHNSKENTESALVDGWYHSGDVGHYDQNGCLYITGRMKEMIKYRMYSVSPGEMEDFILRHDAVANVCMIGVPHSTDCYWIRAYVQVREGKTLTEQELIDYVKDNLGLEKQIRAGVHFMTEMPHTATGKLDRQYFRRLVKDELITESVL